MSTRLNAPQIERAIQARNLSADELSRRLDVMPATFSQWMAGEAIPAANRLLKLSFLLDMSYEDMLVATTPRPPEPVVAYRKKAQKTTTEIELAQAREKGRLLRPLAKHLANQLVRPAAFKSPTLDYDYIQQQASDLRKDIGLSDTSAISYSDLITRFNQLGAVIIPVMWGERETHGNALHIMLPESGATWIYLNLDTNVCDFNFWMAHELAHVYTPDLAGQNIGEDFADAFAQALLFPRRCAQELYPQLAGKNIGTFVNILKSVAKERLISPYTVYKAVNNYAEANRLPTFEHIKIFGAVKNFEKQFPIITEVLFKKDIPDAATYIETVKAAFLTPFFELVKAFLEESAQGPGWLADTLETSFIDAREMFLALGGDLQH